MRISTKIFAILVLLFIVSLAGDIGAQTAGLNANGPFILANLNQGPSGYIRQHRLVGTAYETAWSSCSLNENYGMGGNMSAGDVDNDGVSEVFGVTRYLTRTEKIGKTTSYWFKEKLVVFEPGAPAGGPPSWEIDDLETGESKALILDCLVEDLDGDGYKELAVLDGPQVDVYQLDFNHAVLYRRSSQPLGAAAGYTFGIEAGDVDGCGRNEIVVAMNWTGAPYILKFNGLGGFSAPVLAQPLDPSLYGAGRTKLLIECARVKDVDGDGTKEIVAGGDNGRIMIWKHGPSSGEFRNIFVSLYLGTFYASLPVDAGDINGDGFNEILAGTSGQRKVLPALWVFALDGTTYSMAKSFPLPEGGLLYRVASGDLDADGRDEIALSLGGLRVFELQGDLSSGALTQAYYNSSAGATVKIIR